MSKKFLVVPCYNEAERLKRDEFTALSAARDVVLIFVNDGSTDNTGARLAELSNQLEAGAQIIHLEKNVGKGEAVRTGMLHAMEQDAELVGYIDADMPTPVSEIGRLLDIAASGNYRAVIGARVRILGHSIDRSGTRHYLGRIFATFASIILRIPIYDTQCGAKIFRADASLGAAISSRFHSRWAFDVELIGRLTLATEDASDGASGPAWDGIVEIPLKSWTDGNDSKLKPLAMLRAVFELILIWSSLRRLNRLKKIAAKRSLSEIGNG